MSSLPLVRSHADDLGLHEAITKGIIIGCRTGRITGASAVVTGSITATIVDRWDLPVRLPIRLHYNLTEGKPVSMPQKIPHLVTPSGLFYAWPLLALRLTGGLIPLAEVREELTAQQEKFLSVFGYRPLGFDSHHHIHFHRQLAPLIQSLAPPQTYIRAARDLLLATPTLRGWLLREAIRRSRDYQSMSSDSLLDARWLRGESLRETLQYLPKSEVIELIWHLAVGNQFPWRTQQLSLLSNPLWWAGEGVAYRLDRSSDLTK